MFGVYAYKPKNYVLLNIYIVHASRERMPINILTFDLETNILNNSFFVNLK